MSNSELEAELFKYIADHPLDAFASVEESPTLSSIILTDYEKFEEALIKVLNIQDKFHNTKVGKLFK